MKRILICTLIYILAGSAFFALPLGILVSCNADSDDPPKPAPLNATVDFVTLAHDVPFPNTTIINFSPSEALPAGVTYILTDDRPTPNTWNSATGFNGQVNVSTYNLSNTDVTFTQTFYYNGEKITSTGSERTVIINVDDFPSAAFATLAIDTGSVTLVHP